MSRYDRAITVFSPDGRLYQVEYAHEAVKKGNTAVGIRGADAVVLGVEKKPAPKLQDPRTVRKVFVLDDHICLTFAGLNADGRVLVDDARVEAQSYALTYDEVPTVEYIARHIAGVQQGYTQSLGVRPFGLSTLIIGFDPDSTPQLWQTDPTGVFSGWKASSVGRGAKSVMEFLEKNYKDNMSADEIVKLAVEALLEIVESGSRNMDIVVMRKGTPMAFLSDPEIDAITKRIEEEKNAAEQERQARKAARKAAAGVTE